MKIRSLILAIAAMTAMSVLAQPTVRHDVPRDSIILSDPAVLADKSTNTYYMTGTGGMMWKSKDLSRWDGPYHIAETDPQSWMGPKPAIWAAEFHKYGDKYYYFATFTNERIKIAKNEEGEIPRRASHILVSDRPEGPYRPVPLADNPKATTEKYLPATYPTLDGTFWVDTDGKPYMVFCGEWLMNQNGTMEKIELSPTLDRSVGEPKVLFRASDSPWSREKRNGKDTFNRVTDGPWLFRTGTGRLGMIWTSWVYNVYTMGVAYSESGTLDGPWVQEPEPITPPDHGHGMIFTDLQGRTILSAHSHYDDHGRYIRRPVFWEVDLTGDKLRVVRKID